jgi:hypothetical protein
MKNYIENATILKTSLGYEDHGIPTAQLVLELQGGNVQSFGGLNFNPEGEMKKFVTAVIDVVGVRNWESLIGQPVRVKFRDGPLSMIIGIGHYTKDKWYIPEDFLEEKTKW